jgi:glyoxalase family protein
VSGVLGIHHVTCIAGDPRENLAFYTGVLGMRLVKRTVNQDATDTYHLFYADAAGTPGTDLTFFPWPGMAPGREGTGLAVEVGLAVPEGQLPWWQSRLTQAGVTTEPVVEHFGERILRFRDPHGQALALVGIGERDFEPWALSAVPEPSQIRGLHSVRLRVRDLAATAELLEGPMGFRPGLADAGCRRFTVSAGGSGALVDVEQSGHGPGAWGPGSVHHVAWRLRDSADEMELRETLSREGHRPTPQIDRFWFRSVYFREPGGVLFELATDGPGFAVDEDPEHLGERLILPPWLEPSRSEIEAALDPIEP